MSSSLLLPNPCLLGIVLSISTHDGNHLVFHYPPHPNEYGFQPTPLDNQVLNTDNDDYSSSSSSDEFSDNDAFDQRLDYDSDSASYDLDFCNRSSRSLSTDSHSSHGPHISSSTSSGGYFTNAFRGPDEKYASGRNILELLDERDRKKKRKENKRASLMKNIIMGEHETTGGNSNQAQKQSSPSIDSFKTNLANSNNNSSNNIPVLDSEVKEYRVEKLFTFDADFISELATPPKALCNTRFELTVEDMVFLGLPIHVDDDGNWRPTIKNKSKNKKKKRRSINDSITNSVNSDTDNEDEVQLEIKIKSRNKNKNRNKVGNSTDGEKDSESIKSKECGMYQFNMLFVLNPPVVEYNHRIDEMYHYIISRITLLLRYEQQKTNYIWEESQKIMKLREKLIHSPISVQWQKIIEESSLANVIYRTYESVVKSQIVNIEINNRLSSFQIPIRTEFSSIPPKHIDLPKGSTLSSISPFNQLDNFETNDIFSTSSESMIHFALILLDDPESIIGDIKAERDSVIASFIKMIKPSESLARLSVLSGLDIQEVKLFANHLVYWRRAKAILPLNARNIYVVSPLAPIKDIYNDSMKFNQHFPNLPPLTTFLSLISTTSNNKPRSINSIIPSKDHRDLYLDAVSWLLKTGYLTQLCTCLYLKITKEIKIKVDEEIEMETKKKDEKKKKLGVNKSSTHDENSNNDPDSNHNDNDARYSDNEIHEMNHDELDSSGNDNTILQESDSSQEETNNAGKTRNTDNTAEKGADFLLKSNSSFAEIKPGESDRKKFLIQFEEEEEENSILIEPEYSTALERRWVAKCVEGKPVEIVNLFYKILKYMNGKNPLELFILKENVSRHDIKKLFEAIEEHLVTVRHW